jgi:hypothetical protein
MTYEYIVVVTYFFFIFSLLYASRNVERIAEHPTTKKVMEKVVYNLRDLPRVNYAEVSEEEQEEEEEEEEEERVIEPSSDEEVVRRRRDRNAYSRILEVPN